MLYYHHIICHKVRWIVKKLTVGILAHVDAGKTTLSEALLYTSGQIRKLGRVDRRDCFLDNYDQERARGITIFSKQARLSWKDTEITLLDTPGHADFSAEMERTLQVMDCAVLVISGTDGSQAHTDTLWNLLARYSIPTFIFITKMDVSHFSREELLVDLHRHLSPDCYEYEGIENHAEDIALLDEDVLERYMETSEIKREDISKLVWERKLFPVFRGSGLKLEGIAPLLDALDGFSPAVEYSEEFGARIFKIARDSSGKRMSFMKITGGSLHVRDELCYIGKDALREKVSGIRLYSGQKFEAVECVESGEICAVLGFSETRPGMGLGFEYESKKPLMEPVIAYSIGLPDGSDPLQILPKLKELEDEDPQLHIGRQENGEIRIMLMGAVQTEVLKSLIKERFDIDVSIGRGQLMYRETIASPVTGTGHYEPLKHYAEVRLLIEPADSGTGIILDSALREDELALNWQRLILTHLEEKEHRGVLTGSPLTDVKITLIAGRAHLKHTEGGDFRQATYRAVRQGLMKAESVLLEPYYGFRLELPADCVGRAISDLGNSEFEVQSSSDGAYSLITGKAPAALLSDYQVELMSYTGGRGRISLVPVGYYPCRDPEKVIEAFDYDPEADLVNSPDSIFCSHGAGTVIKWDRVDEYAHCEIHYPTTTGSPSPVGQGGLAAASGSFSNDGKERASASASSAAGGGDIDEKELERIMEREFGPIRRKSYSTPTVFEAPKDIKTAPRKQRLIVDGYNLIFAHKGLKALSETSIDTAREQLVNMMANYSAYTGTETVLVFDAYKVPQGLGEKYDTSGLHVAYTCEGETADMYIERLADEIGKNENVRVVTSDSLIRLSALRAGVLRTDSKEFAVEMENKLEEMRKAVIDT